MRTPLVVALIAGAALAAGCTDSEKSPPPAKEARNPLEIRPDPALAERLRIGEPIMAEVRTTLQVTGRVEADETRLARVGSPVTGRIAELEVLEGETVKRGQVLATLTSTELSATQLSYLKSLSQRGLAERAASRAQQLLDADVIGLAELQRRQAELAQADAELSAARDQLKVLGMSDAAINRLASSRQVDSRSQVVASIDGTVLDRTVTQGQVVQPADTVYVIADLSNVWIVADVPEQSAAAIEVGKAAEAEIAALPGRPVRGALTFVSATVNPETRTVRVRMDVANPTRELKPAMLATVRLQGRPEKKMVIPASAVVREENKDFVFVQKDAETYVLRPVTLGPEQDGQRVLVSGVRDGERVVVDGAFHLNNERRRLATQGS